MRENATDELEPRRLPLVADPGFRYASSSAVTTNIEPRKEAQLINSFAEKDPNSDYYMVRKRPGYTSGYTVGFDAVRHCKGISYYLPTTNNVILAGQGVYINSFFAGNTDFGITDYMVRFQGIPSATAYMVFSPGSFVTATGTWFIFGAALAQIVDPNFPTSLVPGFAYLNGYLYVMNRSGYIYGSTNTDNPTVWNPLNFIRASSEADRGVFLAKQLSYVVALKDWTTQFYYDAGNAPPGSPLAEVQGAIIPWGCVDANTPQEIDDMLIWVATNKGASPRVVILQDLHIRVVSTPAVDRYLNATSKYSGGALFKSLTIKIPGHRFYILHVYLTYFGIPSSVTLVYDIDIDLWYIWSDANGNYWPIAASATDSSGRTLLQSDTDNNLFVLNEASIYPNDNGSIVPVDIYTPNYDARVARRKQLSMMTFNSDQTNGSTMQMRYSDDDYQNWSNPETIDLSVERPSTNDLGTFYRRAFHFRHQCNTDLRIKSIDLQLDIGTL